MNCTLTKKLNEETENIYGFKLKSASLDRSADFCVIELFYRDGVIMSKDEREKVRSLALELLPKRYKYDIKFVKNFISSQTISQVFDEVSKFVLPSVICKLGGVEGENPSFSLSVVVDSQTFDRAQEKHLNTLLEQEYKRRYPDCDFCCEIKSGDLILQGEQKTFNAGVIDQSDDFLAPRFFEVEERQTYIGEEISENPRYLVDKSHYSGTMVFAGRIKSKREFVYTPKKREDAKSKENVKSAKSKVGEADTAEEAKVRERHVFRFSLEDFTGSISCSIFANKQTLPLLSSLNDGDSVLLRGDLEIDSYNNELQLKVKDISSCKLPEKFEEKIVYHKERPAYQFTAPEKFISYTQSNLMNFSDDKPVCPHLAGKTYVCYDLETTGVSYESGDRIIEIGAYKIVDGKITERFVSLVNPDRPIPERASMVNHIYDKDVADAPKDYEILADFYKFTRGSILVGYNNISFDDVFLVGQGKSCRWNFDNESEDAYILSQKYVHDIKNHKLITVAKALGVSLDNAHSAGWDALATAEVFIKLAENLEN